MNEHENKVELVGFYGSDETHALSAWTSTSRELSDEKRGRMHKMLNTLASEGHHTPFEKSSLHFLVTTDIATHIQIIKHRIGVSFNAESARYKELGKKNEKGSRDDKFYIPSDWAQDEQVQLIKHCEESFEKYHACLGRLVASGMSRNRAKESARFYLPYANQLTADVMFNFRSFMHYQGLRNEEHAQKEIRDLSQTMLELVEQTEQFKLSLDAFGWTKEKIYGTNISL
jgi:flavin-dependent thymidylate synthase